MASKQYRTLGPFYPYYLSEHSNPTCRRLHFIGSVLIVGTLGYVLITQSWLGLLILPMFGYGFGWIGHAFFEKNVPRNKFFWTERQVSFIRRAIHQHIADAICLWMCKEMNYV